jgi:hypothetical protein
MVGVKRSLGGVERGVVDVETRLEALEVGRCSLTL